MAISKIKETDSLADAVKIINNNFDFIENSGDITEIEISRYTNAITSQIESFQSQVDLQYVSMNARVNEVVDQIRTFASVDRIEQAVQEAITNGVSTIEKTVLAGYVTNARADSTFLTNASYGSFPTDYGDHSSASASFARVTDAMKYVCTNFVSKGWAGVFPHIIGETPYRPDYKDGYATVEGAITWISEVEISINNRADGEYIPKISVNQGSNPSGNIAIFTEDGTLRDDSINWSSVATSINTLKSNVQFISNNYASKTWVQNNYSVDTGTGTITIGGSVFTPYSNLTTSGSGNGITNITTSANGSTLTLVKTSFLTSTSLSINDPNQSDGEAITAITYDNNGNFTLSRVSVMTLSSAESKIVELVEDEMVTQGGPILEGIFNRSKGEFPTTNVSTAISASKAGYATVDDVITYVRAMFSAFTSEVSYRQNWPPSQS